MAHAVTAIPPVDFKTITIDVIRRAPEWLRRDLSSTDPRAREQAEEALAAMLSAAIKNGGIA